MRNCSQPSQAISGTTQGSWIYCRVRKQRETTSKLGNHNSTFSQGIQLRLLLSIHGNQIDAPSPDYGNARSSIALEILLLMLRMEIEDKREPSFTISWGRPLQPFYLLNATSGRTLLDRQSANGLRCCTKLCKNGFKVGNRSLTGYLTYASTFSSLESCLGINAPLSQPLQQRPGKETDMLFSHWTLEDSSHPFTGSHQRISHLNEFLEDC